MRAATGLGRRAFAALLCAALALWSVAPAVSHAQAVFATLHEHAENIAEHGHSHGFEDDLLAAMHGHGHDAADHDHGKALPALGGGAAARADGGDAWRLGPPPPRPLRATRLDRPPRA